MTVPYPLFHTVMRPPPDEDVATIGGVTIEELLYALANEDDGLPQPKVPTRKRSKKPTLEAKLHQRIAKLIEDAAVIGIALKIETRPL